MGFLQEMKDFNAGMESAGKFWDARAKAQASRAKADSYKITDEDLQGQPNTFTGGGGTGLSSGTDAPRGGVPPASDTYNGFIDTVKTGVTNPYALAAISATGKHESGYGANAFSQWDDVGKPAGGIMSWRDNRLANLKKFAGTDDISKIDAATQGKFFLQEDPNLITNLNKASTVADAQHMMNEAWAFKGYRDPGNSEAAGRLADANAYFKQYGEDWGKGGTAPAAPATASRASAGVLPTGDDGDGGDGEGSGDDDTGTDETEQSQAQQAQPVQTAQAAPSVPVPQQTAMPAPAPIAPSQFASVQGSGFSNAPSQAAQQPSQAPQPTQMAAQQPRSMNQGAGVSRVADAMMTPEEKARQRALQQGALFADKGGVIPPNFGTPEIQKYYARGGTVPKVEHQSTSEWIHDHLPAWLTGEDFGENLRETERGLGRESKGRSVPMVEKEGPPRPPPETAAQRVSRSSPPVIPERGQKEDNLPPFQQPDQPHTMTRALRPDEQEPPTVPAPSVPPPQTAAQQVSAGAQPVIPERGQKEETLPPFRQPDQPHTMTRALRPDQQAAPTAAPYERPTKDDTVEQTGPVLPTAAGAPMQGPPAPRGSPPPAPAPVTPGAARASATPQELPPPEDDYDPLKNWAGMDDPGGLDANARRSSRFEGTEPQTPSNPAFIEPGYKGAVSTPPPAPAPTGKPRSSMGEAPVPEKAGEPAPGVSAPRRPTPVLPPEPERVLPPSATPGVFSPRRPTPDVTAAPAAEAPQEVAGAIPIPGERPANPINGPVPIPQDKPDQFEVTKTPVTRTAAAEPPAAPATRVAAAGRTAPAPTTRHAPQPVQPAPAGGQGRMLNAGSQSDRIYGGSTAAQVRDSRPASPRYLVQQRGHDNPRTVAVAAVGAHHGMDFIRHIFGFDGSSNEAIPSGQGGDPTKARRFINGVGAATPQDNAAIERIAGIDPNLPDPIKHLERLSKVTQVYLGRGMQKEAKAAAASQLIYGGEQFSKLGSLAGQSYQEYLQTGNPAALQHTLEFLATAHAYIPSGENFDVYVDPKTNKIVADITDAEGQHDRHEVTAQELPQLINATKDKSAYWRGIEAIADPAAARSRLSREASDSRFQQGQANQDRRAKERQEHTDANLAETRRRQDEKDAKKAAADEAKQKNKQVDYSVLAPLANKLKKVEKGTPAYDAAASEFVDAIPKGASAADRKAILEDADVAMGDFNYLAPDQRNVEAPAGEEPDKPLIDWSTGNINLGGGKPAAAASTTATPQRPAGLPPDAQYSPSKKGWIVKNPNGGYDLVGT